MNTITMPITKARINLGAVVERVRTTGTRVVLEKGGIPVATIVDNEWLEDVQDYLLLEKLRKEQKGEEGTPLEDVLQKHGV